MLVVGYIWLFSPCFFSDFAFHQFKRLDGSPPLTCGLTYDTISLCNVPHASLANPWGNIFGLVLLYFAKAQNSKQRFFSSFLLSLLVFNVSPHTLHVFPELIPQAFSIPISQVIANDRTHRQRQDNYRQDHVHREEQKDSSDLVSSILQVCHIYATSYIMLL